MLTQELVAVQRDAARGVPQRSGAAMMDYLRADHGDWLALEFADRECAEQLCERFGVRGIPAGERRRAGTRL